MEYQTTEARQLAGLKPVDGVYKLESALEKISVSLLEVSDSSAAHHELQSLHQTYTKYRDEAKELRQKGMASFRKYLAAKNGGHPPSSTPTSSTTRPTTSSTRAAATNTPNNTSNNSVPHRSPNGSSNATQINININNPQSGATATQMSQMSSNTSISTNNAPPPPPSRRSPVRSEQRSQSNPNPNAVAIQQLTKQNESLRSEVEELRRKASEYDETEHELRLILEEYKFTQLSHKQEITSLKNTMAAYKKASSQKAKSLDTLSNEYENTKNRNQTMSKLNAEYKQQIGEYLAANTNLKQRLIEKAAECDALRRENADLKSKLRLSQQLNPSRSPRTTPSEVTEVDIDRIDAPIKPVVDSKSSVDALETVAVASISGSSRSRSQNVEDIDIEQRLRRVYDQLTVDEHHDLKAEVEAILERFHPINAIQSTTTRRQHQSGDVRSHSHSHSQSQSQGQGLGHGQDPGPSVDEHGNYVLTAAEYGDIEQVVEDRDRYLNEARFLQQQMESLRAQYEGFKLRCSQLEEEKSLMMSTLKHSVEKLAVENTALKEQVGTVDERVSIIKEHDQSTLNRFHKIYEENKERKFEMAAMEQRIEELLRDVATFRYLSENLQGNNAKLRADLTDALERIDKVVEDKEIIARKLRESNKLKMEILRERSRKQSVDGVPSTDNKMEEESQEQSAEMKYERILMEKLEIEKLFDESDGTVNELTNQVIELETRLRELELENEMLRKELEQITAQNAKQSNQLKSAQRVALSIMQSNKENGGGGLANHLSARTAEGQTTDMFGLQPPPEPDLITSLLTYLLPFLFEEDDQPKIV